MQSLNALTQVPGSCLTVALKYIYDVIVKAYYVIVLIQ